MYFGPKKSGYPWAKLRGLYLIPNAVYSFLLDRHKIWWKIKIAGWDSQSKHFAYHTLCVLPWSRCGNWNFSINAALTASPFLNIWWLSISVLQLKQRLRLALHFYRQRVEIIGADTAWYQQITKLNTQKVAIFWLNCCVLNERNAECCSECRWMFRGSD